MKETYLVESKHSNAECLLALDDIVAYKPELLKNTWFGCGAGEHVGYSAVEGDSEADIRGMLPKTIRINARILKVGKFTPDQIRGFHK